MQCLRHTFLIFPLLLSSCTTSWLIKGSPEIKEFRADGENDRRERLSFVPKENDIYISIAARYIPPQQGEKTIDLTEVACEKPGLIKKRKTQTAVVYAYIDQQELPIPIFGVSTITRRNEVECVRKMDEIIFLPRFLFPNDGLSVKVDLRHDHQGEVTNEDVQDVLSKVVTLAGIATNGTITLVPAAKLALEKISPEMSTNFNRENYVATHSFQIPWDDRVTRVRYFQLPLFFLDDEQKVLDAGYVEFRVMPRVTRFKNIPLYSSTGTPNYENRYLEDLDDLSADQATANSIKVKVLEFRRDVASMRSPDAIDERCKRFVTDLNHFELNNYDSSFVLYLALKGVKGFNDVPEMTVFSCMSRFDSAIANSFPYWRSTQDFRGEEEDRDRAAMFEQVAKSTLNRLAAGLALPPERRTAFLRAVFGNEVVVENKGNFDFLEGMPVTKTPVSYDETLNMLTHLKSAGMGCYFDLARAGRRGYIDDYMYFVLYRDKDKEKGLRQGFLRLLLDIEKSPEGSFRVSRLGVDEILPSDVEHFDQWCGDACAERCNRFRAPLQDMN